ncbi:MULTISPECIES: sugar ABC transporter substrate-binding protein [unclassified Chelatococcus]|uniref:ABC transporter substrate-binding protein n=1 Tax=unclassified Chelatococcus TaxID=2638111 RepID=UPI001BCE0C12|nr:MULTISPECIES: sugar ABC transporter substrate-binding protein [unclassified Chelatococcus]MBS7700693.1 sugar ABC transporter substrate-binding protein [Chelatococcus sp. YT9]MBX3559124.1 sugar ABC transporter substrate-binding protein [Chelatococcus sp.]
MNMRSSLKFGAAISAVVLGLGLAPALADNIVMWVNAPLVPGPNAPIYEEIKAFEAKTGHKVELQAVPHMEMERNLFVALSGGAGPDVMALDIAWVAGLADAGLLADITEKTKPIAAQYQPGPLASGRFQEKQYALPLYTNNVALFVNDRMLADAGIAKAPSNWKEFRDAAIALTNKEKDTYGASFGGSRMGAFQLYSFIWQNGGEIIDEKGVPHVAEPATVEAVDFLAKLYTQSHAMPKSVLTAGNWDEVHAPFIQERAGMVVTGDWALAALAKGNPNLKFSVHPLPVGVKAATVIGGYNLAAKAGSKSPDASFALIEWLTGPRSVELMRKYERLSAAASATTPEAIAALPKQLQPFMAQADAGRARPVVAPWSEIHASIFANAWDSVIRGKPAQAVMTEANTAIQGLLEKK